MEERNGGERRREKFGKRKGNGGKRDRRRG